MGLLLLPAAVDHPTRRSRVRGALASPPEGAIEPTPRLDIGPETAIPAGAAPPLVRGRSRLQKTVRRAPLGVADTERRAAGAEGGVDRGKAGARVPVPTPPVPAVAAPLHLDAPVRGAPAGGRHQAKTDRVARRPMEAPPAAARHQEGRVDAEAALVGPRRAGAAPLAGAAHLAKDDQGPLPGVGAATPAVAPGAVPPRLGGKGPGALLGSMAVVGPAEVRPAGKPPRRPERVAVPKVAPGAERPVRAAGARVVAAYRPVGVARYLRDPVAVIGRGMARFRTIN